MTPPLWVEPTSRRLKDLHPEHVTVPFEHIVLVEHFLADNGDTLEEWFGVLDTEFDIMHISLRSGSYITEPVNDRTPEEIAEWFGTKITSIFSAEYDHIKAEIKGES